MDKLRSATENLYRIFGSYPTPTTLGRCKHGQPEDKKHFLSTALRKLSSEDLPLAHFSWEAISTWGTVDDFKYFLPRLFEIVAFEKYHYDPEVLFGKLAIAHWRSWPEAEQNAVGDYCDALWEKALANYPTLAELPSFAEIDDCLCSIGRAADDLKPFLERWQNGDSVARLQNLADFVIRNAECLLSKNKLCNAFWSDRPEQAQQVVAWLVQPTTATLLHTARFSDAADVLLRLRAVQS